MEPQRPEGLGSRDRILWAAASMLGEEPGSALRVRAVATRAGVSTGSLQHHFPSKRALMDEVMTLVYKLVLPEDAIHDTTIPARDRLVACLQQILAPPSIDLTPRDAWRQTFDRYVSDNLPEAAKNEYLAIAGELHRRIEYCLDVLQKEGELPPGDNAPRAHLLLALIHGLSVAQALPTEEEHFPLELRTLYTAADYVLDRSNQT